MTEVTTGAGSPAPGGGPRRSRRLVALVLVSLTVLASGAVAAIATVVNPPGVNRGHLVAVGPTSGDNGFPVWYKDDNNVRVEPCIDANDPNCVAAAPLPDPSQPISFPDNFPDEMFYQLADSTITLPGGGKAVSSFNLEGAFGGGVPKANDQIVFGRVRFFYKGLQPDKTYRITHPYGVDELTADSSGAIRFTEDGGLSIGQFGEALNSRIGPFLKWDSGAPLGYLGDGATAHTITGSPYNTNFVRIQGIVGPKGEAADPLDVSSPLFTVMGKQATTGGVGVDRAVYSRDSGGTTMLDVFANSQIEPQSIEVSGTGLDPTRLRGENGHYEGHVPLASIPTSVTVTNVGDVPASKKTATVTDDVTGTAVYDADKFTLTINASSSDAASPPTLTATGFGALAGGTLAVGSVTGAPATVTVTSSAGGSATLPVTMTGAGFPAIPVQAFAGVDQEVLSGATVTLDGSASTGPVTGWSWTQTAGPNVDLKNATSTNPTFVAPAVADPDGATLSFDLTVTGAGGPAKNTVNVKVLGSAPSVTANAGPDQGAAVQTSTVTLDGTGSTGASSYAWTQTVGPKVTLTGAGTSKPTFTMPKGTTPLKFELKASNAGGSSTATVTITPKPDTVTITRAAQYTTSTREWRIEGTSSVVGPGVTINVYNGTTQAGAATPSGTLIGTADVDALGAWKFRQVVPATSAPTATRQYSLQSTSGGVAFNQTVTVK
jgi:hypothetical protein